MTRRGWTLILGMLLTAAGCGASLPVSPTAQAIAARYHVKITVSRTHDAIARNPYREAPPSPYVTPPASPYEVPASPY